MAKKKAPKAAPSIVAAPVQAAPKAAPKARDYASELHQLAEDYRNSGVSNKLRLNTIANELIRVAKRL